MPRFCSIFSQLLQLFPRTEFQKVVIATRAERHARGFTCWGQFVAMLFCQLGRAHSLREICGGLASCEGKLAHLGLEAPARATLAYANAHRPWQLYEQVFYQLLARCQAVAGSKKFRFRNKLVSLDATVIDLCAEMFAWATFRRTKGAVKLHFTLDHDGYLPTAVVITEGKRHEVTIARQQTFAPGTILVFDRGYLDFEWFARLTETGVFFVTRLKDGTAYDVVARHAVPARTGVVADDWIALRSPQSAAKYEPGRPLRRVEVVLPEGDRLVFLTNHLDLGPTTIARIYKDRWQIELLFKALKQNLRVKTFVGTSANALHIQVWTAVIALLILKYLQLKATFGWSLSNLVALLRMNLFVYRDLWTWLNDPFTGPPQPPGPVQGVLI
ncbi:MAG: IS4 family transposase [Acidobacteria bacterium]|nr:IS4 family transposase [Acidobacteriota bacterium]